MARVPRRALDAIWAAVESLLPEHVDTHPLGCHRRRTPDRVVFERLIYRIATGCSYDEAGDGFCDGRVLRDRRDQWLAAGVFEALWGQVLKGYDQIVGLTLQDVSVDGCITKAPGGGESTGKSPVDRGKRGVKASLAVDGRGVPLAFELAGANIVDRTMLGTTLNRLDDALADITRPGRMALHLDRGYDYAPTRALGRTRGFDVRVAERATAMRVRSRQRWVVERTNGWFNHFGQVRRSTEQRAGPRRLNYLLAAVVIVVRRLVARAGRYGAM
jgi:transposase